MNVQNILLPTDFSECADHALSHAVEMADRFDAHLHFLHVVNELDPDWYGISNVQEEAMKLRDQIREEAHDRLAELTPDKELETTVSLQLSFDVADTIYEYVDERDIDLVVMGTHGRRGVDRMLFGSVTEEVVREADCPTLTVRADADATPEQAVRRILVPVDFSDASEVAVDHAKEIALTYGAEIDLLHVVEQPFYPSAYGIDSVTFPTQEVVDRVEKQLGELARTEIGYEHVMVEATAGDPADEILSHVDDNESDLVVIATHGRTGLDRILLGSVAERVLRRSEAPVFVVKPDRKSLVSGAEASSAAAGE